MTMKLRLEAVGGDAEAQYQLGLQSASSAEGAQTSVHWFVKAAEQGHALAQFNLGLIYAGGQGVAQIAPRSFATTPRKLSVRMTRTSGIARIEDSSTDNSFAPIAEGRSTRPCNMSGMVKSCRYGCRAVHFAGTSLRRIGFPTTV